MTVLNEKMLHSLGEQLPGRVSMPGEDRYLAATSIWAKPVDITPYAIVHCRTAGDVQAAIRAARDRDLALSVRGGGHDWAGRSLCNGLVIDLSAMRNVMVGADGRIATIFGGTRAADVAAVTDPLQRAAVAGSAGAVGMTGLTLGGGYGPLIGRFGLALDNVVGAQIVLADGSIVSADAIDDPELFWALRGGGGNFGVVTAMRHRLHELPSVHSGLLIYPFSEARTVIERCIVLMAVMPDELTVQIGLVADRTGAVAVMLIPTWCGAPDHGDAQLAPFSKLGTLLAGNIERKSYGALLATFDPYIVNGMRAVVETCSVPELDGACVDVFIHAMETAVSPGCAIVTHDFKGAASRIAERATAFGLRRDHVLIEVLAAYPDRSNVMDEARHRAWARATREAFTTALPGGYPNFLTGDDEDRAALSYGGNAQRLIDAKRRYDPDNIFSSAIPLPPSA
jgi:hypothetical protein